MSAAIAEPVVQSPKPLVLVPPPMASEPKKASGDRGPRHARFSRAGVEYPLLPVFIAGGIAMAGALVFVGWILMWLALRHTGINATW